MTEWKLEDFFTAGYAFAGSYGSFYDVPEDIIGEYAGGTKRISIKRNITMPPKFKTFATNFVNAFREYGQNNNLGYSVQNRDIMLRYADRESYLCHVLFLQGLTAYVNDATVSTDVQSFTLSQILSYAIDTNLLLAINVTSMEDIAGTVLRSGDVILCRTAAGTTAETLYGIGDIYVWDDKKACGLKWTVNGLIESQDIRHPAVVFRPLLEQFGLSGMGREEFDTYINKTATTKKVGSVVQQGLTGSSNGQTGASGNGGTIDISTAKKYIWTELMKVLQNEYAVAGIMGNIAHESGFKSNNLQNTYEQSLGYSDAAYTAAVDNGTYTNFVKDSAGYGLVQWTYWSRKQGLLDYAKQCGTSIGDLAMQTSYVIKEMSGNTQLWSELMNATDVFTASNLVLFNYEKPADQSEAAQNRRANSGKEIYNEFHGTDITNDVILNTSAQPTGASTVIAETDAEYEASGLLKDRDGNYLDINTSAWTVSNWAPDWHIGSHVAKNRKGRSHNGIDMYPANNGTWNRYTIQRCKVTYIKKTSAHWLPVDSSWVEWYEESNPTVKVPVNDIPKDESAGTTIKYQLLDGSDVYVQEMHFMPDSIPSSISVGDILDAGTLIGIGGNTGKSTGRHIHFEMRTSDNKVIDSEAWLKARLNIT